MRQPLFRTLTLLLATALAAPLHAEETVDSGAYLAARIAESENDFRAAATWYGKAILSDTANARLLEGAILAELGIGDMALAIEGAKQLKKLGGEPSQLGDFALLADEAQREDYAALLASASAGLFARIWHKPLVIRVFARSP